MTLRELTGFIITEYTINNRSYIVLMADTKLHWQEIANYFSDLNTEAKWCIQTQDLLTPDGGTRS